MSNTFFTADTHFGHANIIKYCNRPFSSVDEHDECLIANWNSIVKIGDVVYHLGDFGMLPENRARAIRRRLNGNVFFIEGNHDKTTFKIRDTFGWYNQVKNIRVDDSEFYLSHYAMRIWPKSHYGVYHLYGHSHNGLLEDPNAKSMDVGVDAIAARLAGLASGATPPIGSTKPADYRPISIEEIKKILDKKIWKPIDHHDGIAPGRKFGKWTVLSFSGKDKYKNGIYLCHCECGLEKTVIGMDLINDRSHSCSKCANQQIQFEKELPDALWKMTVVAGASKREIDIQISLEQAYDLFLKQDRKCNLTGWPISFGRTMTEHIEGKTTASLDRIDSNKAYTIDNVQ